MTDNQEFTEDTVQADEQIYPRLIYQKTKPWKHQVEAYHKTKDFASVLFYMGMGTGKSRCVIDQIANDPEMKKILIVCPLSVINAWEYQFELHWPHNKVYFTKLNYGSAGQNLKLLRKHLPYCRTYAPFVGCINYESVWRGDFAKYIAQIPWDMVVADEIQRIKSPGSKVSRFMGRLTKKARRRVGLSGTPLANSPLDANAELRIHNPDVYGTSFVRLRAKYAVMGGYGGYQVLAYKNQADFNRRFYSITHRVDSDVLDLPPTHHVKIPLSMKPKNSETETSTIYRSLERVFIAGTKAGVITVSNALVKLLRLQQITSGYMQLDDPEKPLEQLNTIKEDALIDILTSIGTEPIVVFCRFTYDLTAVHRAAETSGLVCLELSGEIKQLEDWQKGKGQVLAVQISSGAEGISLVRACYAVYYSLGFSLSQYEQSLARLDRPGQTRPVTYYHLIVEKTVDEKLYKALDNKRKVIEELLLDYGGFGLEARIRDEEERRVLRQRAERRLKAKQRRRERIEAEAWRIHEKFLKLQAVDDQKPRKILEKIIAEMEVEDGHQRYQDFLGYGPAEEEDGDALEGLKREIGQADAAGGGRVDPIRRRLFKNRRRNYKHTHPAVGEAEER